MDFIDEILAPILFGWLTLGTLAGAGVAMQHVGKVAALVVLLGGMLVVGFLAERFLFPQKKSQGKRDKETMGD